MDKKVTELIKTLWDYLHVNNKLKRSDCIIAMGCHDMDVARKAGELYLENWAGSIVATGGSGKITRETMEKPEAEVFKACMVQMGVPQDKIIVEKKSANTQENILFTKEIIERSGHDFNSFILVNKPYMERRTHATFALRWPEKDFIVTSEQKSFEDYIKKYEKNNVEASIIYNLIAGEIQRIKKYPQKGWMLPQEIPHPVWRSYEELAALGYNTFSVEE